MQSFGWSALKWGQLTKVGSDSAKVRSLASSLAVADQLQCLHAGRVPYSWTKTPGHICPHDVGICCAGPANRCQGHGAQVYRCGWPQQGRTREAVLSAFQAGPQKGTPPRQCRSSVSRAASGRAWPTASSIRCFTSPPNMCPQPAILRLELCLHVVHRANAGTPPQQATLTPDNLLHVCSQPIRVKSEALAVGHDGAVGPQ